MAYGRNVASCDPLRTVHVKQKKIMRICTNSHYLAHSPPLFADLNTLTVYDIHKLQIALFMYKFHHKLLPDVFSDYFVQANTIHGYSTRQSHMYRPSYFNTDLAKGRDLSFGALFQKASVIQHLAFHLKLSLRPS